MNARLRKERTEEIIGIAREQLADERVQEKLGDRGKILQFVADMMHVPDIDGSYLVEFPEYENQDIFPVVHLNKDDRLISTMTARMPIQHEVIRAQASRQWDEQEHEYSEDDIQQLLDKWIDSGIIQLNHGEHRSGFHAPYKNIFLHQDNPQAPVMVHVGRPHIALQLFPERKITDEASTLVHELSHAVDAVREPLRFMENDSDYRAFRMNRLRGELAAYATESIVRRIFRSRSEAVRDLFLPRLCDTVESHRRSVNGPYTSEQAFDPNWTIEKRLARAGLSRIYWDKD